MHVDKTADRWQGQLMLTLAMRSIMSSSECMCCDDHTCSHECCCLHPCRACPSGTSASGRGLTTSCLSAGCRSIRRSWAPGRPQPSRPSPQGPAPVWGATLLCWSCRCACCRHAGMTCQVPSDDVCAVLDVGAWYVHVLAAIMQEQQGSIVPAVCMQRAQCCIIECMNGESCGMGVPTQSCSN